EWYLVIIALTALSAVSALWDDLLYTLPLLVLAAGILVTQAFVSAAKARFPNGEWGMSSADSALRFRSPHSAFRILLTAFLYMLQPLARLHGRLRYGLTLWRRHGPPGFMLPRPRAFSVWSEHWQAPANRLESI